MHVTGIDISPASIAQAKRFAKELGLTNIDFLVADGGQFTPTDKFDQVIDTQGALVTVGSCRLISTMLQWLNPGGKLFCLPPIDDRRGFITFLAAIEQAGGALIEAGYVEYSDWGRLGSYPTIVIASNKDAEGLPLDCAVEAHARMWESFESRRQLQNVLTVYFEDGVEAMAGETLDDPWLHEACLLAIDAGIEAASRGEPEWVRIIRESPASDVNDAADARALLERVRIDYLAAYDCLPDASGVVL